MAAVFAGFSFTAFKCIVTFIQVAHIHGFFPQTVERDDCKHQLKLAAIL